MFNLTLSPPILEIIARPGATITQAYEIANNSDTAVTLNTSVVPFSPKGIDGSVVYDDLVSLNPNIEFSLQNTDAVLNQPFTIPPLGKKQLVLKIKTLSNIPQTDSYYTFFLTQTDSGNTTNSSQTTNLGQIGSHILISSSDTQNQEISASVSGLSTSPTLKDVFLTPIKINAQVDNLTYHFFKTDGKVTILKNGKVIKEWKLYPQNVLASHSRSIQCADNDLKPVDCTLPTPLWPGAYSVQVESNSASASTIFFVWPLSLLFPLILIFLILTLKRVLPKGKQLIPDQDQSKR